MALTDEMSRQGLWLFRWRSYLPLVLLFLLPASLIGLHWPFGSYEFHEVWEFFCLMLSFVGLAVRCATVGFVPAGTSGRGTGEQCAEVLNTTGLYSVVRHPLYLGNYLIGLGVMLVWINWWVPLVYTLFFWVYYERIMVAEERYLEGKFGDRFRRWAVSTPAFIPRFSQWRRPSLPFSVRSVLRREYTGLMVVVLLHSAIEVTEHIWMEGRPKFGPDWTITLVAATAVYLTLRMLKKRTELLNVAGR